MLWAATSREGSSNLKLYFLLSEAQYLAKIKTDDVFWTISSLLCLVKMKSVKSFWEELYEVYNKPSATVSRVINIYFLCIFDPNPSYSAYP